MSYNKLVCKFLQVNVKPFSKSLLDSISKGTGDSVIGSFSMNPVVTMDELSKMDASEYLSHHRGVSFLRSGATSPQIFFSNLEVYVQAQKEAALMNELPSWYMAEIEKIIMCEVETPLLEEDDAEVSIAQFNGYDVDIFETYNMYECLFELQSEIGNDISLFATSNANSSKLRKRANKAASNKISEIKADHEERSKKCRTEEERAAARNAFVERATKRRVIQQEKDKLRKERREETVTNFVSGIRRKVSITMMELNEAMKDLELSNDSHVRHGLLGKNLAEKISAGSIDVAKDICKGICKSNPSLIIKDNYVDSYEPEVTRVIISCLKDASRNDALNKLRYQSDDIGSDKKSESTYTFAFGIPFTNSVYSAKGVTSSDIDSELNLNVLNSAGLTGGEL
jgi:hypothetical protein